MIFSLENQNAVMPSRQDLDFFEKVIEAGEAFLNYGVFAKASEIPIIFVSEETMRQKSEEYSRKLVQDELSIPELFEEFSASVERFNERATREWYESTIRELAEQPEGYLGFFVPNNTIVQNGPAVWICYSRICAEDRYDSVENIRNKTLTVIIHELGHAIMAAREGGIHALNIWVEEPLANLIALQYLNSAKSNPGNIDVPNSICKCIIRAESEGCKKGPQMGAS